MAIQKKMLGISISFSPQFVFLNDTSLQENGIPMYIAEDCKNWVIFFFFCRYGAALLQNVFFRTNQWYCIDLYIMQNDTVSTCTLFRDISFTYFLPHVFFPGWKPTNTHLKCLTAPQNMFYNTGILQEPRESLCKCVCVRSSTDPRGI